MSTLMDFLDDYVLGPLNLLDRIEGLLVGLWHGDLGYELAIPRADKDGDFSLNEVRALLAKYGVVTYGRRFDARNMYIRVKKRQARWAEYILLHAGVELRNPIFERRNPGYVAQHAPGWMPRPWSEGRRAAPETTTEEMQPPPDEQPPSWLERILGF